MAKSFTTVKGLLLCSVILLLDLLGKFAQGNGQGQTTVGASEETTSHNSSSGADGNVRLEMARLMKYIRELPVALEKVPPLVTGKPKVTLTALTEVFSVLGVDDVQQTVKTVGLLALRWQDKALAWNISDYGGITSVELPREYVWMPSVYVGNSLDSKNLMDESGLVIMGTYDGWVYARTIFISETICDLELTHYPFDQQACPLVFVSHSRFVSWEITEDVVASAVADTYAVGSEWDVLTTSREAVYMADYDEEASVLTVKMKRKTTFYVVCLVLPMALTSYMNTLVFLLPLQSGEKISYLVTVYVSTSVFVSYFTNVMPRGLHSVPHTMMLLIGVIVESLIVTLATIIVLRRFHNQAEQDKQKMIVSSDTKCGNSTPREKIPLDEGEEVTTSKLCCPKDPRVKTVRVAPAPGLQNWEGQEERKNRPSSKTDTRRPRPTAEQLDRVFFVLTFVGNTIFLATLLYQSASA